MSQLQSGKYRITNVATSLRLDDKGDHREDPPASAYVGPANGGTHQIWDIKSVGDGVYELRNEATKAVLDGNPAGAIYTLDRNGGKFQQWRIVPNGSFYHVTSQGTDLRLESAGGNTVKGAKPTDSDNQNWVIVKVS